MTVHRTAALLLAALALGTGLITGCAAPAPEADAPTPSASPEPSEEATEEQTAAEACAAIEAPLLAIGEDLDAASAIEDPTIVAEVFATASDDLTAASAELRNPEVKAALDTATTSLDDVAAQMNAIVADPENADLDAFQGALLQMQEDFAAVDEACTG